jgi:hypothetical protein
VAVIENHNGDSLANVYSNARNNFYNITGFPTMKFDGVLEVVGGSGSSSLYGTYVPIVAERNAIPSDFTIDIELEHTGLDYTATITMENVGGNTSTNLVLQTTITESKLPIDWGLGEYVNSVNRLMVPDQSGTALDFSGNDVQTVVLDFTMAGFWDADNCEVIAFIQDNQTKEINQGTKIFIATPEFSLDAQAKSVKHPTGLYCGSTVEPVVIIKNMGAENLTSLDIEYSINGGDTQTYNWTGDLGFNLGAEVALEEMGFNSQAVNTFDFTVSNPNGQPDMNPDNNSVSQEFEAAYQVTTSTVNFELMTDQYPAETSWQITNSGGEVVYSGDSYSGANTLYTEELEFNDMDCYTFTIFDSYGDGICCAYGEGYYKLMDGNNVLFAEGGEFGSEESKPFERAGEAVLTADFMADATSIEEGDMVTFSDLSMGTITSWSWEFEGGDPASSDEQNPEVTYVLEGVYDVTLTVSDGTNSSTMTKEDYIAVDHVTGVSSIDKEGINLFPNPTTGKLFIEGVEGANIKVYNIAGKVVASYSDFSDKSIDLSGLENGVYFIDIVTDNNIITQKVSLIK